MDRKEMKIGIKYCGGCNPHYNRLQIEEKLKRDFEGLTVKPAASDEEQDVIAVICGCRRRCADRSSLDARDGKVVLSQLSDYSKLYDLIKMHLIDGKE